jgi:hypothetical protein
MNTHRSAPATFGLAAVCLALTAPSIASAQTARDPVGAETLFKTALERMDKGDWTTACAKFAASQEMDPAVATLVKLSQCREHEGKLAEAWYLLQEALKLNHDKGEVEKRRSELEAFTKVQIQAIEGRLPRLRIQVNDAPPGLSISRDGQSLPVASLGEAMPANPGAHKVLVSAPGFVAQSRDVTLREGQSLDVTIALIPAEKTPSPALAPSVGFQDAQSPPMDEGTPGSGRKTAGFVLGGIGILGLATSGILFGVTASTAADAAPDVTGNDARDQARATQTGAFIAGGAGLALLGTGIALIATAPKSQTAVSFHISPAHAIVMGSF